MDKVYELTVIGHNGKELDDREQFTELMDAITSCRFNSRTCKKAYVTLIGDIEVLFECKHGTEESYIRNFYCVYDYTHSQINVHNLTTDNVEFGIPHQALVGSEIEEAIDKGTCSEGLLAEWVYDYCSDVLSDMGLL